MDDDDLKNKIEKELESDEGQLINDDLLLADDADDEIDFDFTDDDDVSDELDESLDTSEPLLASGNDLGLSDDLNFDIAEDSDDSELEDQFADNQSGIDLDDNELSADSNIEVEASIADESDYSEDVDFGIDDAIDDEITIKDDTQTEVGLTEEIDLDGDDDPSEVISAAADDDDDDDDDMENPFIDSINDDVDLESDSSSDDELDIVDDFGVDATGATIDETLNVNADALPELSSEEIEPELIDDEAGDESGDSQVSQINTDTDSDQKFEDEGASDEIAESSLETQEAESRDLTELDMPSGDELGFKAEGEADLSPEIDSLVDDDDADLDDLIDVSPLDFPDIDSKLSGKRFDMDMFVDIPVKINVELGEVTLSLKDVYNLTEGAVVELDKLTGEFLPLKVNNQTVATGEVVVVDNHYGIRIKKIYQKQGELG
jgi:flagellar motor switch protein FliN